MPDTKCRVPHPFRLFMIKARCENYGGMTFHRLSARPRNEIRGKKGVSPATDETHSNSCFRAYSRAASTPASGPRYPQSESAIHGNPNAEKRPGSPFTFNTTASTCGLKRFKTSSRIVCCRASVILYQSPPFESRGRLREPHQGFDHSS